MKQLHSTTRMILIATAFLVINAICIFAYRDAVLTCETHKDSMLYLSLRYETLTSSLINDLSLYESSKNEEHLRHFDSQLDDYYLKDNIDMGFYVISEDQAVKHLDHLRKPNYFPLESQRIFLQFSDGEQDQFRRFSRHFEDMLDIMKAARADLSTEPFSSAEFRQHWHAQASALAELSEDYITRTNKQEDRIIRNQTIMEFTLVSLSILLLFLATFGFYLLNEENRLNAYFRKLYNTIVENINVGLSVVNENGTYEYTNPQYQKLLGIEGENAVGKSPAELFPTDIAALLDVCSPEPTEGRLTLEIQKQQRRYIDYDHFIIFDENNQKKYVDLLHETTQTEELKQQLYSQLHEIKLYSHAKDAFLANISHEIKTPINAIVGMTHFLRQTDLLPRQQDIVSKLESSADVLLSIINDVLDFSKIKAHSLSLYPTAFRLSSVLRNIEDMFASQIASKGLEFKTSYDIPQDLVLYMDRTRLIQLFVNLLSNATKFTDKGTISLSIVTKNESNDSIDLEFCVEDSGIGIAKKDISKLFQEFEQIENHLTKQHQGTGLGLPICKHIVETMGGEMWVTSIVGTGSKFYFSIPCPKATTEQLEAIAEPTASPSRFDGQGARVLVVEDTEINLEIVTKLLQDVNVTCHTAKDGMEAIDICKMHDPDFFRLILMDIHMPRMDGYTASHILKDQLHIDTPIIALTATSMEEASAQQCKGVMSGYILKPFKIEAFYQTLAPYFVSGLADPGADKPVPVDSKVLSFDEGDPYSGREEAIHNLGGMTAIYYKHVSRFKMNYADSTEKIKDFLNNQDYDEAKRAAHSVKGLSGTLGMTTLYKAAATLVSDIVSKSPEIEKSLAAYDAALQQILQSDPPQQ